MAFDLEALRGILACPQSRSPLVHSGDTLVCVDPECRLSFPIRDDIPNMLIDDATELPLDEWGSIMQTHGRDSQSGEPLDQPAGG